MNVDVSIKTHFTNDGETIKASLWNVVYGYFYQKFMEPECTNITNSWIEQFCRVNNIPLELAK